jgi:hypothetical protein
MPTWLKQRIGMLLACVWGGGALAFASGDGSTGWYVGIGIILVGSLVFYLTFPKTPWDSSERGRPPKR